MGGNQSTSNRSTPENDQEYFGVKLSQSLMDDLAGSSSSNSVSSSSSPTFDITAWRSSNSVRQKTLDSNIQEVEMRATLLLDVTKEQVSKMETKLFSSLERNKEVPCSLIQKELANALEYGDLEYVKTTNLELKDCLRNAMDASKK